MQISCERCSTVYVLDDKLIPPSGAPVQCTRCGLVFTAKPPEGAVSQPPPPKPTAPPPSARMPAPAAPAAPAPDPRRSTMMFGGAAAPASPAPAPSSPTHSTMMFGGATAPASPAPAPLSSAHSTMMFGGAAAPASPAPAPQSPAHSTMMFGGAAAPPPPASAPQSPAHSTMMFGGAPAEPPRTTQMFGAAPSTPPPAAIPSFVAPPPPAAAPSFAAAAPKPGGPTSTMMFGAAPAEPPAPAAPPPAAPISSPATTMMFGGVGAPAPQAAPGASPRSTMMFGAAPVESPAPVPLPAPAAAPLSSPATTMMFGGVVAPPQPEGERAPAVEMPLPPAPAPEPQAAPASDISTTDPDLAPPPDAAPAPSWLASPQPEGAAPEPAPAPETDPAPEPAAEPSFSPEPAPARRAPGRARPSASPAPLPMAEALVAPEDSAEPAASQTLELQRSLKRRQNRLPIIAGAVVAALVLGAGTLAYFKLRTPPADPALVAADAQALELLKRDDEASLEKAIAQWEALEAKAPKYVPFKANQIIAHVFRAQDLRDEIRRLTAEAAGVERRMRRFQEKKEPRDWAARANAAREELIRIKAQVDPLQEQAAAHGQRADELLKASKALVAELGAAGDGASVFRASALYYATKGHETAEKLAEFYRRDLDERKVFHDDARAFADLALAGMHAQPRISKERRDLGVAAAAAALKGDEKLLRAHLFEAKIYLANREYPLARGAVERLLGLNPEHKAALKLKTEIELTALQASSKPGVAGVDK